jgi:hypothetical protein
MTDEDRHALVPLAEVVHELIRVLERVLPDRDARGAPTGAGSLLWLRVEAERVRDALGGR